MFAFSRPKGFKTAVIGTFAIGVIATQLVSVPAQAAPNYQTTDAFLKAKFVAGQYIEGFTPGVPDYGFSLEALLQRKALDEPASQLEPAVSYLLINPSVVIGSASTPGYLFSGGRIRLGLAGKWAFVSAALGAKNSALRHQVLNAALAKIDGSGDVAPDAKANTYDRAWLVLALVANHLPKQAVTLAANLSAHALPDGGFNDGFTVGQSSTDGTGITLQALAAALPLTKAARLAKASMLITKAESRAVAYLNKTAQSDHFESYGDADVNGTAYAIMGLVAAGGKPSADISWLKNQLATDGGLATPWSAGSGDTYATAQGVVAMLGKSYLKLISRS